MSRVYSNCNFKNFRVSKVLKSRVDDCLNILIDNGISVNNGLCFLYKKDNIWYLRGGDQDLGFLGADNEDKEFKDLLIAIKNTVNQDFVGVVFPNGRKGSCFGGNFSIVLDNESMDEVFDEVLMTDETLGGRLYWFVPCLGFSEACYGVVDFVYDRLKKKVYVPITRLADKDIKGRLNTLRGVFFKKWQNGTISVPVYLENGEKFECKKNSDVIRKLPSLCLVGLSFKEEKLEDGSIKVSSVTRSGPIYFDIQEKGKDLVCTFNKVQCRFNKISEVWVEKDFPVFPDSIIVGRSPFGDELNVNEGVLSGKSDIDGCTVDRVRKKKYVDYKNGTLVSEKVNLRDVTMVRWFEIPREYKIGYILFKADDEKVTSELYMLDLRSERVSKVATKSLLMADLEDDSVIWDKRNCNGTMFRNNDNGVHLGGSLSITARKSVYCYYSEKTKEFYLSPVFIRFDNDGTACATN